MDMHDKQLLVIQTDQEGAASIQRDIAQVPDARCQARQIQGQVGTPNEWSVVVELTRTALGVLADKIKVMLRRGKGQITVKNPTYGEIRCRSVEDFERIIVLLKEV